MRGGMISVAVLLALTLTGCATVDVTKTAKGFFEPTRPDDVEILMSRPSRSFVELATVSTANWNTGETAKMHNAIRAKTAPLGAHAVVITDSGIVIIRNSPKLWCTGFALRYEGTGQATRPAE
ncbi:MAG: hypothetical protein LC135_09745 [Phycisphaerae bacterium]|nr:hypothetical protein [Phycisphaerae bacterium]MCZ2400132.1 hypothetical protein [Phycisphaerae bacterium]NUQ47314.1 hypothetical protein [Phycisphaerae bacterium]